MCSNSYAILVFSDSSMPHGLGMIYAAYSEGLAALSRLPGSAPRPCGTTIAVSCSKLGLWMFRLWSFDDAYLGSRSLLLLSIVQQCVSSWGEALAQGVP